jgi:hypothetical protein
MVTPAEIHHPRGREHVCKGYVFWTKCDLYGMVTVVDGFDFNKQPFFVLRPREGRVFLDEFFGDLVCRFSACEAKLTA